MAALGGCVTGSGYSERPIVAASLTPAPRATTTHNFEAAVSFHDITTTSGSSGSGKLQHPFLARPQVSVRSLSESTARVDNTDCAGFIQTRKILKQHREPDARTMTP